MVWENLTALGAYSRTHFFTEVQIFLGVQTPILTTNPTIACPKLVAITILTACFVRGVIAPLTRVAGSKAII
jgi:hypothetical protein